MGTGLAILFPGRSSRDTRLGKKVKYWMALKITCLEGLGDLQKCPICRPGM